MSGWACVKPVRDNKERKSSHGMLQKVSNGAKGVRDYVNGKSSNRKPETASDIFIHSRALVLFVNEKYYHFVIAI